MACILTSSCFCWISLLLPSCSFIHTCIRTYIAANSNFSFAQAQGIWLTTKPQSYHFTLTYLNGRLKPTAGVQLPHRFLHANRKDGISNLVVQIIPERPKSEEPHETQLINPSLWIYDTKAS